MSETRYSVGIDLGTTNSVVAYVDLSGCDGEKAPLEILEIPQLTAPGTIGDRKQLPSFMYQAHEAELAPGDIVLPWDERPEAITGELARQLGAKTPIRLVASAKSWLCHSGVDCRAPILPVQAPEEVKRVSPLQASIAYLRHMRDAWNARHPEHPLSEQDLTITVPASFDPAARELTVEAAHALGLRQAILLEEPQSALYSWIQASGGGWREQVKPGDVILVVDVGGGTTDLSLIAVTEADGNLELNRIAIGDHILLGGDNMDLALAYGLKLKLEAEGKKLESWQVQALMHGCRDAKESLLSDPEVSEVAVVVPSRGSSLIGGTLRTALTKNEVNRTLVEGFFPQVPIDEKPLVQARTGLTTLGLPYAKDARITCHLAAFLSRQVSAAAELEGFALAEGSRFIHPTALLLNGGVFKAEALERRLLDVLNDWLRADGAPEARLLHGADLDLAVARGAAYYGYVRKGKGVRIRGGTAAAYYVGVESAMPAVPGFPAPLQVLCIAPFGMEEGTEAELPPEEFGLVVGEPVRFRFFASTLRREDLVGTRLEDWREDEIEELHEIEVTLPVEGNRAGEVVPVRLAARATEVGTLQLEAVARDSGERWKVEFEVRSGEKPVPAFDEVIPEAPYLGTLEAPAESVVEGDAGGDEPAGKKPFWSFNK
ncbi:DnaK-related protein [Methylococcus capsulatus str. Bath]|uniref:DnaK-related protein n=1 Tax=Methylococcus capsulatus (strain ATCC 33009 / NCIMB 11132 / Bath) TaxID=243233 RepID=Q609D0_METCA|nr:Hsp70 family protein [Methylococcus capsulatus]AAU92674.1 DnaK-related protein [Methylococcus capsulatus str. Bath]